MLVKLLFGLLRKLLRLEDEPEIVYVAQTFRDPQTGQYITVEALCSCGWNVAYGGSDEYSFYCEHCDRGCLEGLPTCEYCVNLASTRPHGDTIEE